MAGKLIELPRKLEWNHVETWVGKVRGTSMWTQVSAKEGGDGYLWGAWNSRQLVDSGEAPDLLAARKAAEEALESGVVVIRPLPSPEAGVH